MRIHTYLDEMTLSKPCDEGLYALLQTVHSKGLTIDKQPVATRDLQIQYRAFLHKGLLTLLLSLSLWRQLARDALVHVHIGGNEEENEQHKRNIGRRRCIQLRYTTPAMMEIHHNFRLYFVAP